MPEESQFDKTSSKINPQLDDLINRAFIDQKEQHKDKKVKDKESKDKPKD